MSTKARKVKAGDLIAEIDSAELEAQKNAAQATIDAYNWQVSSHAGNRGADLGETNSGVVNAQARLAAARRRYCRPRPTWFASRAIRSA